MVSGSIELMPEYKAILTDEVNAALDTRIAARNGEDLSTRQKEEIAEQVETGLKLQQVEIYDPGFLNAPLRDHSIWTGMFCRACFKIKS